jgi:hypothetical protein
MENFMEDYQRVLDRLSIMECPAGKVENKVIDIFVAYQVADENNIRVKRDEKLDRKDLEGYRAEIYGANPIKFALLCKSGQDDYVSKIVDVYKI